MLTWRAWPLSDHINTDEAYANYSEYKRDDASGELEGLVALDDLLPEAPSVRKAGRLRTKWTFT